MSAERRTRTNSYQGINIIKEKPSRRRKEPIAWKPENFITPTDEFAFAQQEAALLEALTYISGDYYTGENEGATHMRTQWAKLRTQAMSQYPGERIRIFVTQGKDDQGKIHQPWIEIEE